MTKTNRFKAYLSGSVIIEFILRICAGLSLIWKNSVLITLFVRDTPARRGVFGGITPRLRGLLVKCCNVLRFNKAFNRSIFAMPMLWCGAAAMLAPILPTIAAIPLALLVIITTLLKLGANKDFAAPATPQLRFFALYSLTLALSIILSVDTMSSLTEGGVLLVFSLTAICAARSAKSNRQVELALSAMVFGGIFVALYGILQYFLGVSGASMWVDDKVFGSMTRVYSTLQNPNMLAAYLLIVIPFAAAKMICASDDLRRLFWLGGLGIMLLCMVFTFARGGWLGIIIAAAIFLIMLDRRFIFVFIIGLLALAAVLPQAILARFLSIGNVTDGSTSYRVFIWLGTLPMVRDHIIYGIGPGITAFSQIYPLYAYNAIIAPHSHNLFLQILCDGGLMSFSMFIAGLLALIRRLASGTKKTAVMSDEDKKARVYRIAAISSLIGFIAQGMTDYSFYNYRVALVFWLFIGFACALSSSNEHTLIDAEN